MTTGIERLKLMREKLAESAAGGGGGSSRDPSIYPFWNIKVGESCVLRFLPDKDENNPYPWVEKILFKWNFPDPRQPQRPVTVTMPCREMYDGPKTCPVMNELRPLWKSDEETAKRFWPKRSYVYSGFVRKSSWQENPAPENPIRKFFINKKMHGFIKETLLSTNEETMFQCSPDDFENGTNFVVKKTKDGQWDSYATSQWANQSSCLTNDEIAAIEKYGLIDLKTAFPQRPSDEAFAIQMTMLHAAMDGKEWDPAWDAATLTMRTIRRRCRSRRRLRRRRLLRSSASGDPRHSRHRPLSRSQSTTTKPQRVPSIRRRRRSRRFLASLRTSSAASGR